MLRLTVIALAIAAVLAPAAANACAPPMVTFGFGSIRLSPEDQAEIASVAKSFRAAPGSSVELTAQTDGSKANVQMARRRAHVIKAALVRRGVPARSIEIEVSKGAGDARLVVMEVVSAPTC